MDVEGSERTSQAPDHAAPGSLVDRGRRLFEFLAEAQLMKAGRSRTTDTYDSVSWLGHLPDHAAVRSAHRTVDTGTEDPILLVDRVPPRPGPPVPDQLVPWLDGSAEDPGREPHLREKIANPSPSLKDGSDAWLSSASEIDVLDVYRAWLELWTRWADQELADRPARDLYKHLFAT